MTTAETSPNRLGNDQNHIRGFETYQLPAYVTCPGVSLPILTFIVLRAFPLLRIRGQNVMAILAFKENVMIYLNPRPHLAFDPGHISLRWTAACCTAIPERAKTANLLCLKPGLRNRLHGHRPCIGSMQHHREAAGLELAGFLIRLLFNYNQRIRFH